MLKAKMWTCAILKQNFTNWCIPFHFWVDTAFKFKGSFISTKKLQSHQKPITWHHTKAKLNTMTELQEIFSIGNNTGLGWSDVYSFWILSQMFCNSFLVFLAQTSSTKWNQGTQTILCFTFRYKQKSLLDFPSKFTQELPSGYPLYTYLASLYLLFIHLNHKQPWN